MPTSAYWTTAVLLWAKKASANSIFKTNIDEREYGVFAAGLQLDITT
jgi:hypothetical protein